MHAMMQQIHMNMNLGDFIIIYNMCSNRYSKKVFRLIIHKLIFLFIQNRKTTCRHLL